MPPATAPNPLNRRSKPSNAAIHGAEYRIEPALTASETHRRPHRLAPNVPGELAGNPLNDTKTRFLDDLDGFKLRKSGTHSGGFREAASKKLKII